MEGLSLRLKHSNRQGISISQRGPFISHLLFADDSIIFSKGSTDDAEMIKQILQDYSMASGQTINYNKSLIVFSCNTPRTASSDISTILQTGEMEGDKYLGLPSSIPRSKKQVFLQIQDHIKHKMTGWKEKLLSMGEKRCLLKQLLQLYQSMQ
ncbi:hypothetical protein P3X46_021088 [Hevea brasiliensis]|uniref:Reverse transcriptase domain-containing protein n=1 Tax=Hevea brasiliensis TaxID=3981 RepID=A0ABQ9LI92_HEVBR|nr:hypothetical protein P3X46_021088 [Hevea brasiliensis]